MAHSSLTDAAHATAGERSPLAYQATAEERTVLALERIADQLTMLRRDLAGLADPVSDQSASVEAESSRDIQAATWDNAASTFNEGQPTALRVVRSEEESFSVGGYRYTNLQHAIEEAKRARRAADNANVGGGA
jgi:uncharacterized protein YbaP (TraB family)